MISAMILAAAAQQLGVDASELSTRASKVVHNGLVMPVALPRKM